MKIARTFEGQISDYLKYCREEEKRTDQTMHGKAWVLNDFVKFTQQFEGVTGLGQVTEKHINLWLAEQDARGCSGRTINGRWYYLRPFIKRYRDLGLRIPAVIVDVKEYDEVPPRQNYFTVEQIEKALQFANPTQWLLIKIKFDAGLRISELTNLRLQQISDRRLDYKGKGRKKSHSFMSPATRERLDEYIRYNKIKDYLWENRNTGKPYSVNYIRDLMGEPFQHAGIEGFYPHSLRHSFATDFRRHGASIEEVSKALNHSNVAITETYVHELEKHKEKMFDKYKFGILDEQEKFSPDNDPAAAFAKSLFQQLFERSGVAVR